MTFLYFACTTFSLCYLAADARIFGADTTAWNEVYFGDTPSSEVDDTWLYSLGVLKIRQYLLLSGAVREHLSCYFCMGVWAGPAAHALLRSLDFPQYWLQHANTTSGWTLGLLCAFLVGSCCSYFINAVMHRMEA